MIRIAALAGVAGLAMLSAANAEPISVRSVMCDTARQVEQFAEAVLGAQLSIEDALKAVGRAAGEPHACVFLPVLVDDVQDEKTISHGGIQYAIRRVSVIALMHETSVGLVSQQVEPRVQYSLAMRTTLSKARTQRPRLRR